MKMQKEEKIVVVLLFMALSSLVAASWALGDFDELSKSASYKIDLKGTVSSIKPTMTGGHLIIHLDTTSMPIFVSQDSGADELSRRVHNGDLVSVTGEMGSYNGQNEILIKRSSDVKVL